jgi:TM2 domain-containing membrane protein YozV
MRPTSQMWETDFTDVGDRLHRRKTALVQSLNPVGGRPRGPEKERWYRVGREHRDNQPRPDEQDNPGQSPTTNHHPWKAGMLDGMTDPSPYARGEMFQPPPPPGYPFPPPPQGFYPPGSYADPAAPYGRHPLTGEPLSDKSKVVAGLLQLLGIVGIVGIGRIYLGQIGLGVAQLIVGIVTCGIGAIVWGIVDAVLILTDNVRDSHGRPLRDGT